MEHTIKFYKDIDVSATKSFSMTTKNRLELWGDVENKKALTKLNYVFTRELDSEHVFVEIYNQNWKLVEEWDYV